MRPTRHAAKCAEKCAPGCPIREYEADMAAAVLPSEIAEERRQEERFKALARGEFPT